jgi:hypothetical protein
VQGSSVVAKTMLLRGVVTRHGLRLLRLQGSPARRFFRSDVPRGEVDVVLDDDDDDDDVTAEVRGSVVERPQMSAAEEMDSYLLDRFDADMRDLGSTGVLKEDKPRMTIDEEGKLVPVTRRYIWHDYRKTFSTTPKVGGAIDDRGGPTLTFGDGITESELLTDVRDRRLPPFELNMASQEKVTPEEWMESLSLGGEENFWIQRHITTSRVVSMTAKGKNMNMKSMIVIGNCRGTAGYGVGKGESVAEVRPPERWMKGGRLSRLGFGGQS